MSGQQYWPHYVIDPGSGQLITTYSTVDDATTMQQFQQLRNAQPGLGYGMGANVELEGGIEVPLNGMGQPTGPLAQAVNPLGGGGIFAYDPRYANVYGYRGPVGQGGYTPQNYPGQPAMSTAWQQGYMAHVGGVWHWVQGNMTPGAMGLSGTPDAFAPTSSFSEIPFTQLATSYHGAFSVDSKGNDITSSWRLLAPMVASTMASATSGSSVGQAISLLSQINQGIQAISSSNSSAASSLTEIERDEAGQLTVRLLAELLQATKISSRRQVGLQSDYRRFVEYANHASAGVLGSVAVA
jgi:hypothetical protein